MRNLLLLITLISGLAGCSHESNFSAIESISAKEKPLKIITRILTTKSANFVQEFKEGSEIRCWSPHHKGFRGYLVRILG